MELHALAKKLLSLTEPAGTLVTLALDVSKASEKATRVYFRDVALRDLAWTARPQQVQDALHKISRKVEAFVSQSRVGAKGLYLVAGATAWESAEVQVPFDNFIHVGRKPIVAPLVDAEARAPRTYDVLVDGKGVTITESRLGGQQEVARIGAPIDAADVQHTATGRSARIASGAMLSRRGSATRDRFQQRHGEAVRGELREAAARLAALQREAPAASLHIKGPDASAFRALLSKELTALCERDPQAVRDADVKEFRELYRQGTLIALGPRDVLEQLSSGKLSRVFVRSNDPIAGVTCPTCRRHWEGTRETCDTCPSKLIPTSLTDDLVVHALKHGAPAITFVSGPAKWLADLGGMAALVTRKGRKG